MMKRKNPFNEVDCNYQVKMFVNQKVMDTNSDDRMQKVYEKTKQLLWAGSKTAFNHTYDDFEMIENPNKPPNVNPVTKVEVDPRDHLNKKSQRQLIFSLDKGQLCVFKNKFVPEKDVDNYENDDSSIIKCVSCRKKLTGKHKSDTPCSCCWCNDAICPQCIRRCVLCNNVFCFLCSLLDYTDNNETAYCLQCKVYREKV